MIIFFIQNNEITGGYLFAHLEILLHRLLVEF